MAAVKSKKKKPSRKAPLRGKGPTFESVWATLQEIAKMHDKMQKENAEQQKEIDRITKENAEWFEQEKREYAERRKKADQEMQELKKSIKETDRIVRRNGKQMGELHRRFGQLAEHLVAPGIAKRFNELGYHFNEMSSKGQKIFDEKTGKIKTEIDLVLENGKTIMAVEIKTRPLIQDIEHHIKRLEILRDCRRGINNDQRKVQGAIAGAIFEDDVKEAVREAGLYVIEQSGDTMKIDMPDGFIPREW